LSRFIAAPLLVTLAACACSSPEPPASGASSDARIEQLRALPYVDFAGGAGDTGEDGVVRRDPALSWEGYTLYTSRTLCMAELIDGPGKVVRSWSHQPCHHWSNATLLPGGDLLAVGLDSGDEDASEERLSDRYLIRFSWDGAVRWKLPVTAHHDAQAAPDGNLIVVTAHHRREPAFDPDTDLRDNHLSLLSPEGEVLGEISLYDLLSPGPAGFSLERAGEGRAERLGAIDLFHANTVGFMPFPELEARGGIHSSGSVMVTLRNQDTIAIIDWPRREVLWTWGRGEILGPHDATWLENGHILVFDNGLGRDWSRVIEIDPLEKKILWEFKAPDPTSFYSASRGGAQRLPNGNTLITESDRGHGFEVTPEGSVVWEFWNPNRDAEGHRATIFRMRRYEKFFVAELLGS